MGSTTINVDFDKLKHRGQSAATLVQLMMACNDLALANQALGDWKNKEMRSRTSRGIGAGRYFIRMQFAHLHEGLKVIEDIKKDPMLTRLVSQCDSYTQECFKKIQQYTSAGSKRERFKTLASLVRHNLTSHYSQSGKLIQAAIEQIAAQPNARVSSITRGTTQDLWHFKVADDVVDSIVVHKFWEIPRGEKQGLKTDAHADEVHQIFLQFMDFAGEFIWKYCETYG
jgi:hypothetical protein